MATTTRLLEGILKAYWKLDGQYGATIGNDSIGTNTLNLGVAGSATGKVNQCATFARASSQYLAVASNANLQSLKSVSLWVKFATISNDMTIIHKGSTATAANSSLWLKYDTGNNRIQFQVGDGSGNSATCSTAGFTFATGTWYFVTARYNTDTSRLSLSVNGTVYGTASCSLTQFVETGVFYLGRDASGSYLDGSLDEVCVSASAFTIAEELALYNGGSGTQVPILEGNIGPNASSGRYPRRLSPSFTQADNGDLYIAFGDEGMRKWNGIQTTFPKIGVPAPTAKPALTSGGEGRIIGDRYAYVRNIDADGRVSNLSPISNMHSAFGSFKAITAASNASPIVITSTAHGLTTGELVSIQGIQGNTAANGEWYVNVLTADTFELVTSAGNGDFLSASTGMVKVTTLRDGAAAVNEVQTITASATPSGGTWTITFNGSTTSALAAAASAATVQTALRLLPSIAGANITVSGGPLGTAAFTLTFSGTLAGADQPAVTVDSSSLLGASVSVDVAVLTEGSAAQSEVQQFQLYGTPTGGTFTLSFDGQTTAAIAYNANNAAIDAAIEAMSTVGVGQVTIGGGALPGNAVTVTFGGTLANTNVSQMTINGASLTGGSISVAVSTPTPGVGNVGASCVAFWKMNETSGTRYDSVGSYDLTAFSILGGTVASGTGKIGNAVSFDNVIDQQNLQRSYNSNLVPASGGSFSVAAWVYLNSTATGQLIGESPGNGSAVSWYLDFNPTTSKFRFSAAKQVGGTFLNNVVVSSTATASTATWYLVVGVLDAASNKVMISVNGAAFDETASSDQLGYPGDGTRPVTLGARGTSASVIRLDGRLDEVGLWSRALNMSDVGTLYSSGSGITPPFAGGTNEVQRITVSGSPSQGSFTLTFGAATSAAIPYNSTAGAIDTILEAMSTIGTGNVSCAGGPLPGSNVDVEFTGTLAATNVAQMTANSNLLTCSITTTTQGNPGTNEIQRISASPTPISGTFTLTFGGNTTSALAFDATAAQIDTALEALASIGAGQVACTGGPINSAPVVVTFGGTLANTNVATITSTSSLLGATATVTVATTTDGKAALNERQQIYEAGVITGGNFTLSYGGQTTGSLDYTVTAADTQTALTGLSTIGSGNLAADSGSLNALPINVEFQGTLAGQNLAEMTVTSNVVAGGFARGAQYLTYSNVEAPTDSRVVKRQILRNKFGDATVFYLDVETTDLTSTSFTSYKTDEELGKSVALQDANGNDLNVIRHAEPPNWKRVISNFLNRIFAGVNHVWPGEGTFTNASTAVVGQDAELRSAYANREIYPQGTGNDISYSIDSVNVNTQTLTDTVAYAGTTANGVPFAIEAADPEDVTFYFSELDDPESWNVLAGVSINRGEQDGRMTGLAPLVTSMLILFEHRTYKLTFSTSPLLSADPEFGGTGRILPASWRGCVNNDCWQTADGEAYFLDNEGVYKFDGTNVEDFSQPIQPMFQSGNEWSIYWPASENFHCAYDALNNTMRWFVVIGDGRYPKHAICWHIDRQHWWIEEYPVPITSSCYGKSSGREVVFYGTTARRIVEFIEDLDFVDVSANNNATLRGTVTSSAAYTLTDSNAVFPTGLSNIPITIVSGTGNRQQNIIVSNTGTKLTLLNPWRIAPDTTSVYQIGGIQWRWKSSQMRLAQGGSEIARGIEVTYTPTTRPSSVTFRKYADFDAAATTMETDTNSDGISTRADSDEIVIDLTHTTGFVAQSGDSFFTGRGTHPRYTTIELEGVTNGERQKIEEVSVIGVES